MGRTCQHCREELPEHFELCWNCGASIDGILPPTNLSIGREQPLSAVDSEQFPLRSGGRVVLLLLVTTLVPIALAWLAGASALFLLAAVIVTNLLGIVLALMVTHLWGLPDDGSLPKRCRDEESAVDGVG